MGIGDLRHMCTGLSDDSELLQCARVHCLANHSLTIKLLMLHGWCALLFSYMSPTCAWIFFHATNIDLHVPDLLQRCLVIPGGFVICY